MPEGIVTLPRPVTGAPTARPRRHRLAVLVLSLVAAAIYAACEFRQFHTFHSGTYDLVLFDQAVRSYSHFRLPVAIAAGVHRGFGTGFSLLGDHFSPILALLAPLYWIHSGPQTLLVAQALLFAAAVPPLWVFVRRELGRAWPAYGVAVGYLLSWPVAQAVSFDFHEVAFAPVLTAVLFERLSAHRAGRAPWWQVALPAFGLLLVKEDVGLLVAGFGLAVLVRSWRAPQQVRRPARWLGAGFVVAGLGTAVVTTGIVLPAFGSRPKYYWRYGEFGSTVPTAAWHLITHPLVAATTFVTPETKVHTMVCLFVLTGFLALGSPYLLAVLPLLADRMLADAPNWWGLDFHYNAYLVVPVLCAGVDTVARLARWSARPGRRPSVRRTGLGVATVWPVLVPVVAVLLVPSFAFAPLLHPSSWRRAARPAGGRRGCPTRAVRRDRRGGRQSRPATVQPDDRAAVGSAAALGSVGGRRGRRAGVPVLWPRGPTAAGGVPRTARLSGGIRRRRLSGPAQHRAAARAGHGPVARLRLTILAASRAGQVRSAMTWSRLCSSGRSSPWS